MAGLTGLPFVWHWDDDLIVQSLPGGFMIMTRETQIFIDGSTHELRYCQPTKSCKEDFENMQILIYEAQK